MVSVECSIIAVRRPIATVVSIAVMVLALILEVIRVTNFLPQTSDIKGDSDGVFFRYPFIKDSPRYLLLAPVAKMTVHFDVDACAKAPRDNYA